MNLQSSSEGGNKQQIVSSENPEEQKKKKDKLLEECCRELKYRKYSDGEEITKFGDYGEEFFILIQGQVGIHTPKTIEVPIPLAIDSLTNLFLGPIPTNNCT